MLQPVLLACVALSSPLPATAQLSRAQPKPITTDVKDAGTYHLASGTWTRGASSLLATVPDSLYDNTCTVGMYYGMGDGDVVWDSGRIPSMTSPSGNGSLTGTADYWQVEKFYIGYCSFEPLVTSLDIGFKDCYSACDNTGTLPQPDYAFSLLNVPAGTASGGLGCWTVTISLLNSSSFFGISPDCDGVYEDNPTTDSFGWSWTQSIPTTGSDAGPIMAGDPSGFFPVSGQVCGGVGDGTFFPGGGPGPGTGIGVLDQFEVGNGPTAPGCYWFGGYSAANPLSSFYMRLSGYWESPFCSGSLGAAYCFGDGTGALCPCGNLGALGSGCANSGGSGARLTGFGCPSVSFNGFGLHVSGVNGAKPGLLIRGDLEAGGGLGVPAGDGRLCTTGASQRSQVQVTSVGGTSFNDWNGASMATVGNIGSVTNFQFWYRDPVGSPCGTGFNFSNGWRVWFSL